MNLETLGDRLTIEEGDRLVAYLDSRGILTIYRGHNCVVKPLPGIEKPGDVGTPEQDEQCFQEDVAEAVDGLDAHLPWWRHLPDNGDGGRQNVMLDMVFNLGIHGLLGFPNTLAAIKNWLWETAVADMRGSRWAQQVGKRAIFLENAMLTGVYG